MHIVRAAPTVGTRNTKKTKTKSAVLPTSLMSFFYSIVIVLFVLKCYCFEYLCMTQGGCCECFIVVIVIVILLVVAALRCYCFEMLLF